VDWTPLIAWLVALAVAVLVLGFCAYEVGWRTRRLRTDLARLQDLGAELAAVATRVAALRDRVEHVGRS
jgi:type VI protein secretion system component VasK